MDLSYEINDDYDHLDESLEYILENVVSENVLQTANVSEESYKLKELFNTLLLNKCDCSSKEINHQQCLECGHGGNYVFDKNYGELVLNTAQDTRRDLIYECTKLCECSLEKCFNRLVQSGPRKFLQIIDSSIYYTKGLKTIRNIPKGAFICEYAGELLTLQEARKVLKENDKKHKMNYVLFLRELDASNSDKKCNKMVTIVDPSKKGNIGRYLNHSCTPNCRIISVRVDCPIPKIAIFSNRVIKAGEELCFNYNEGIIVESNAVGSKQNRIPCLCKSKNCLKYLPNYDLI